MPLGGIRALSRSKASAELRAVLAYHCRPASAVGTCIWLRFSATRAHDNPDDRKSMIVCAEASGSRRGGPRRTPDAFLAANASRVR